MFNQIDCLRDFFLNLAQRGRQRRRRCKISCTQRSFWQDKRERERERERVALSTSWCKCSSARGSESNVEYYDYSIGPLQKNSEQ